MNAEACVLRSEYHPTTGTISIALRVGADGLQAGWRLALTSILQITPPAGSGALLVDRLASYHELTPTTPSALDTGATWRVDGLAASHRPRHAADGPVSAFVILRDGATTPVRVDAMCWMGDDEPAAADRIAGRPRADHEPPVVPHPVTVTIVDPTPSGRRTASFGGGPDAAASAWRAIVGLGVRSDAGTALVDDGELTVHAADAPDLGDEAYRLAIDGARADVAASTVSGFRHAFVTLAQWLAVGPPTRVEVDDAPRYAWRGLHVDLARQWFEPGVVERLIDVAAWRKLSRLHLHLTDDESWRLPVASHPELAAVGATRGHGLALPPMLGGRADPTGRAYTPDEIARWVDRADELGVVLVPEVDLPAHVHAALTALPSLRDPDDASGAASVQSYVDNVLVPGHPMTTPFVEAVIGAVVERFPSSPWIHVGGDEVAEGAWRGSPLVAAFMAERGLATSRDVEASFHRDLARLIRARFGRSVGAWEEAAESGGLHPDDGYVVGWRTVEASRQLAAKGHDVVVAPGQAYYLDMASDADWSNPGASWAGETSLADVCAFEPDAGWSAAERAHLLGVQACLWTEYVHDEAALADRLFPRLDAIAERGWTGTVVGGPLSLAARSSTLQRSLSPG